MACWKLRIPMMDLTLSQLIIGMNCRCDNVTVMQAVSVSSGTGEYH